MTNVDRRREDRKRLLSMFPELPPHDSAGNMVITVSTQRGRRVNYQDGARWVEAAQLGTPDYRRVISHRGRNAETVIAMFSRAGIRIKIKESFAV